MNEDMRPGKLIHIHLDSCLKRNSVIAFIIRTNYKYVLRVHKVLVERAHCRSTRSILVKCVLSKLFLLINIIHIHIPTHTNWNLKLRRLQNFSFHSLRYRFTCYRMKFAVSLYLRFEFLAQTVSENGVPNKEPCRRRQQTLLLPNLMNGWFLNGNTWPYICTRVRQPVIHVIVWRSRDENLQWAKHSLYSANNWPPLLVTNEQLKYTLSFVLHVIINVCKMRGANSCK